MCLTIMMLYNPDYLVPPVREYRGFADTKRGFVLMRQHVFCSPEHGVVAIIAQLGYQEA